MNRELTLREKVLLLILIVLVMVLGYFKLLYEPVSDRIARCREDTAQEQLALEQNAVRLAQMEKMEQALADIRAAGLFFGWKGNLLCLILACIFGIVFGLLAAGRGGEKGAPIPWGPSIALGAWVTALAGEPFIRWYLSLL